jgi:hypothetical protein
VFQGRDLRGRLAPEPPVDCSHELAVASLVGAADAAGTDDPIVPVANSHVTAKLIPDARLVTSTTVISFLSPAHADSADIVADFLG